MLIVQEFIVKEVSQKMPLARSVSVRLANKQPGAAGQTSTMTKRERRRSAFANALQKSFDGKMQKQKMTMQ